MEPKIDVRIPYEPEGRLGEDYNRIMSESKQEWVLFKDHDVLLFHPSWYRVCQEAIRQYSNVGIFTIWCNNIGNKMQKMSGAPSSNDAILMHKIFARQVWKKNGYSCTRIDPHLIGGFFLMTSKSAWLKAGKFRASGLFGEDHEYHRRMIHCGLATYRINGLYAVHLRERADGEWIAGIKTTKEYWLDYKKRHA